MLLAALGFWLAGVESPSTVWNRPGLPLDPAGRDVATDDDLPSAVPYSGPRVELRPVGHDTPDPDSDAAAGDAAAGFGQGMMGRGHLRSLVDEAILLPPQGSGR
jgi:hypothetical protein